MNISVSVSGGDSGKCAVLLEGAEHGNMFSFSRCATSHWEEDGSNYQRQQLRESQASAHQSALLLNHCAHETVSESAPKW